MTNGERKASILVVEDEIIVAKDIEQSLSSYDYKVVDIARSGEDALKELEEREKPDLILMDIRLNGVMDGIDTAMIVKEKYDIPIIYLTAYTDEANLSRAKETEPYGYLPKPFSENELHTTIVVALYKHQLELAHRTSEQLLRTTLEHIQEGVITTDINMNIRFANPHAVEMIGSAYEELNGKAINDCLLLLNENNREPFEIAGYDTLSQQTKPFIRECLFASQITGQEMPVNCSITPIVAKDSRYDGLVFLLRDIREQRKIHRIESTLAAIVDFSEEAIISAKPNGNIISWNPGAEKMFGYREEELKGKSLSILTPPYQPDKLPNQFDKIKNGLNNCACETTAITKDGRSLEISLSFSRISGPDGELKAVSIIGRDVSLRKRLEKEVLEASETERKRIGQDLHDSLGQQLTGILLKARYLENKTPEDSDQRRMVKEMGELLEKSIEQTRSLAKGLVPITLNSEGLKGILEELADYTESIYGIDTVCETENIEIDDLMTSTQLYRIAQEAVNNAYKHGKPKKIWLRLFHDISEIILEIRDNGKGIDGQKRGKGLGLQIMEYRANMIGAHLEIFKPSGGGTAVVCRTPYKEHSQEIGGEQ